MNTRGGADAVSEGLAYLYDFFISYAAADEDWVRGYLLYALEKAGKSCLTSADFQLGQYQIANIQDAVLRSRRTLLILSPEYLFDLDGEDGRLREFAAFLAAHYAATNGSWSVIPVKRREVELPPHLGFLQGLDCRDEQRSRNSLQKLLSSGTFPADITDDPPPPCPYPGLAAYRENDSGAFFGRSKIIGVLVQRLNLHPFLTIVGASGSGKSSLVNAGLIPALRKSPAFGEGQWHIVCARPGDNPLASLSTCLGEAMLGSPDTALPTLLENTHSSRLLIFIDQFEELFTHKIQQQERDGFIKLLLDLAKLPYTYLVLAIREDFFRLLMSPPLHPLIEEEVAGLYRKYYYDLPPLGKDELAEIIREPARQVGVYLDRMLVERMVNDAADEPGILPFIQETMVYLWNDLQARYLPLAAYDKLQYAQADAEPIKGLKAAITLHAEHVFTKLDNRQQAIARRIFIRLLEFVEGRPEMRRQQLAVNLQGDEDPKLFNDTLEYLTTQRLLTVSGKSDAERKVDIAHESLIHAWNSYQGWIKTWGEAEKQRRSLEDKYSEWLKLGRKGGLLDKAQLAQTKQWEHGLETSGFKPESKLSEYIKVSEKSLRKNALIRILLPVLTVALMVAGYFTSIAAYHAYLKNEALKISTPLIRLNPQTFSMGSNDTYPGNIFYPQWQIKSWTPFSMEKYEVTNHLYCLCTKAGICNKPQYSEISVCDDSIKNHPVVQINLHNAASYCSWLGRRLPFETEWEYAAQGTKGIKQLSNGKGDININNAGMNNKGSGGSIPVYASQDDKTHNGIYGLLGNVGEWTFSPNASYPVDINNEAWWGYLGNGVPEIVIARGANWYDESLENVVSMRTPLTASEPSDHTGFRCVVSNPKVSR